MKATLRKNGKMMITFQVKHVIDRCGVIQAILYGLDTKDGWAERPDQITRKELEAHIRYAYQHAGVDLWARVEAATAKNRAKACAVVDRLFPELKQDIAA